jgi:hypothetical protein
VKFTELSGGVTFEELATEVAHVALDAALGTELQGDHPIDAEYDDPRFWSERDVNWVFDALGETLGPRDPDMGREQSDADRETHKRIVQWIKNRIGTAYVAGEEAPQAHWDWVEHAPLGSLILITDAVDGSRLLERLLFGFGMTLLAYGVTDGGGHELLGSFTINSSGVCLSMDEDAHVRGGRLGAPLFDLSEPWRLDFVDSVAVVAAEAKDRRRVTNLLATTDLPVYTTGGAPAALGLALGKLGAVIWSEHSTIWDTAPIPPLAVLGLVVSTLDGQVIGPQDVFEFFKKVGRGELRRPVPPLVVGRSPELVARVRTLVTPDRA